MAFEYLSDLFGRFRWRKSRFTKLEAEAKRLMDAFVRRRMSDKEFAERFDDVRKKFAELLRVDGQLTIDEDTPLWLNSLLGTHYDEWRRYQQVKWYFEEHPENLTDENRDLYADIMRRGFDRRFLNTCKETLRRLRK